MLEKLKCEITKGPSLADLQRSHNRHVDHPVFLVEFAYTMPSEGHSNGTHVLIQVMKRPKKGRTMWTIHASCRDTSEHDYAQVWFVMVYDPDSRKGYLGYLGYDQPKEI